MLPDNDGLLQDFEERRIPSLTFKLDEITKTITSLIDEKEALIQSMDLMINIERYLYTVFSKNYGSELYLLVGENMRLACYMVEAYVREALSIDNRILELKDFKFSYDKRVLDVEFTAVTVFGELSSFKEVRF